MYVWSFMIPVVIITRANQSIVVDCELCRAMCNADVNMIYLMQYIFNTFM